MPLIRTALSVSGVLECVLCSCLVAEFAGYWLHRLLHSDKLPFLSREHMIHHFLIYGPQQPMRAKKYKDATDGRFSAGNVGLEWLVPSALILFSCWGAMIVLHVPRVYQFISLCNLLLWPILMFSYIHDRMHLRDFWMADAPIIKLWFRKARRLHDIHHRNVNDVGHMNTNFGIGFYFFDRLFRTIRKRHRAFNWKGYREAIGRYGLEDSELLSLQNCSEALFRKPPQERMTGSPDG